MSANKTLNAFIAGAGVCSRRKAVDLIKLGVVTVNGIVRTDAGYRVSSKDVIKVQGSLVKNPDEFVYILLNKPRDYITTCSDEKGRKTVMDLLDGLTQTVFPIGRLDRNTTGLLLFTNDGAFAQALSHPSKTVLKEYMVTTHIPIEQKDLEQIKKGITLDDGFVSIDGCKQVDMHTAQITLHSGKYRIIRRIFEHFGYEVVRLDRIVYAGLTKKGLSLGSWRYLRQDEVEMLKRSK